ncbi:MAG: T9SS type A sorting domain-containing protein [Saprospiraceae bacterium]|nr:T9SS type A sorting domain-containing protein [Saprospiraceae bacterium]
MKSKILLVYLMLFLSHLIYGQNGKKFKSSPYEKMNSGLRYEQRAQKVLGYLRNNFPDFSAQPVHPSISFKKRLDSLISEEKILPDLKHKSSYTYQSIQPNAKLTSQTDYTWSGFTQSWLPQTRIDIMYDLNGKIVQHLFQFAEQNNWVNESQIDYHYSQDGYINRILYYEWNSVQKMWEALSKDTFLYDNKFNIKTGEYFLWDAIKKKWAKEILTENEYNAKSQIITTTYSRWNQQFNNYFFETREEWTYHPNGKQFEFISSNWDDVSADWIYSNKFSDLYDASGKLILFQQHVYDGTSWIPNSKTEITYDPNNNPVRNVNSLWNETLNRWELFFKWENEYDNLFSFQDILIPNPEDEGRQREFNHMLLRTNYFGYNAGNPVNDAFETYFYSDVQTVGTNNSTASEIWVYPNPAQDVLYIRNYPEPSNIHFKLLSADGVELINKTQTSNAFILPDDLVRGIYFYTITDQKKIHTGKIYKE